MRPLTPDQLRLRAELAAAQEQIVTLLRSAVGEPLGPEQARAVAEEARAWRGANAFRLVRYLSDRPDALSWPSSDCPTCVVRLLAALTAVGHGDRVALVPCGDCGRTEPLPTNNGPEGRLCSRCAGRRAKKPCARCGKVAGIYARRPEGGICNPCRNKEPDAKEECADCHRMMISYRRLPDGTSLCQTCAPKNTQTCCRCGRVRRVNALTSDGPVCGRCYSSPARLYGVCGQIVPIVARADGSRPDTCDRCYKRHERTCAICDRVRPGHHINGGLGPFHVRHVPPSRRVRMCPVRARREDQGLLAARAGVQLLLQNSPVAPCTVRLVQPTAHPDRSDGRGNPPVQGVLVPRRTGRAVFGLR